MAIQAPTRLPMEIESQEEGDLGSKRMVVNFGPQHPAASRSGAQREGVAHHGVA